MFIIVRYVSNNYGHHIYKYDGIVKKVRKKEQAESFKAVYHSDSYVKYVVFKEDDNIPDEFEDYPENAVL